jgi:anti-anti-sigma factor
MSNQFVTLEIYKSGDATVIGFGDREVLDQINIAACREQVAALVQQDDVKTLAFNLTGVQLIPSGMLGLMASLRDLGVAVRLINPSDDIREVLEITKLNQLFEIQEVPS